MPDEALETIGWRTAYDVEVPGGAATVAKSAAKNGWSVRTMFCRVPWLTAGDDDEGSIEDVQIVEMVSVQGRKGARRFHANWHRKLWTKPGQEGNFSFAGARMWPAIPGAMFNTKAKKDRHPENIEDATIGGLKNSKTLTAYLKQGDDRVADKED